MKGTRHIEKKLESNLVGKQLVDAAKPLRRLYSGELMVLINVGIVRHHQELFCVYLSISFNSNNEFYDWQPGTGRNRNISNETIVD